MSYPSQIGLRGGCDGWNPRHRGYPEKFLATNLLAFFEQTLAALDPTGMATPLELDLRFAM
jgi:hypothetical protein